MPKKKAAAPDTSHHPYVSNYPPLREWLDKHDMHCMWQVPANEKPSDAEYDWVPQSYIECWRAPNSRPFIIVVYNNRMGWEIYTDGNTPKVDDTLRDAERRLGLTS